MDIDYLVMLSILQLHGGKSIIYVDGKMSDVAGINDIRESNVYSYLISIGILNIDNKIIHESISRLQSKGHLFLDGGRLCPSLSLVHYFVEIIHCEKDIRESTRFLSNIMSKIENRNR